MRLGKICAGLALGSVLATWGSYHRAQQVIQNSPEVQRFYQTYSDNLGVWGGIQGAGQYSELITTNALNQARRLNPNAESIINGSLVPIGIFGLGTIIFSGISVGSHFKRKKQKNISSSE